MLIASVHRGTRPLLLRKGAATKPAARVVVVENEALEAERDALAASLEEEREGKQRRGTKKERAPPAR